MLAGRFTCGKTTLSQALRGEQRRYAKTQYVQYGDVIIDTPGEYTETRQLGYALALYSYEADVVGLLLAADEPYSLYSPNIVGMANRDVIGIVAKIDKPGARPERARRWLALCGCHTIFCVSAYTGEGLPALLDYLMEDPSAADAGARVPRTPRT